MSQTHASATSAASAQNLAAEITAMGKRARDAARILAVAGSQTKSNALKTAAELLRDKKTDILKANDQDMKAAQAHGLSGPMLDRLKLDDDRIEAMAIGLETVAALPDPVGDVMAEWDRPNGLHIKRVRVPIGVVGIIYESRPNVTADAGALCLKAGNAAILRGGSESFHSSAAIADILRTALEKHDLPVDAIQSIPVTDRAAVGEMLKLNEFIDVIVPRGGRGLIERVMNDSRIPVFAHLDGICHVYLHASADPDIARTVTINAKMRRPSICGAAETLLCDRTAAEKLLPPIIDALIEKGCEIRGDEDVQALDNRVKPATEADWSTEYLDAIISVRLVDGVDAAIDHINTYGSHHTDSIISTDEAATHAFQQRIDSGIVMHNASTQFADGGEFGMGAEIGIATGKLHARGPVGAEQLTSYKYIVEGTGQTRP